MSARKRPTARTARQAMVRRLELAMDRCARMRGEAQWVNGYRTAAYKYGDGATETRLHPKEMGWWKRCGDADRAFHRLAQQVVRQAARERAS